MTRALAAAISVAAAVLLAAVPADAETIRIEVKALAFAPAPAQATAHVGDTIEWVNSDFVAHTATAKNHDWDVSLPANKTGRVVLKKAGTVEYFCRFHP